MASSLRSAALGPLLARAASLIVTAAGSVAYAKILVGSIGVSAYGLSSLFLAAMWVLPVLVDGSRTVIVNAVAGLGLTAETGGSQDGKSLLASSAWIQFIVGLAVFAAGAIATAFVAVFSDEPDWAVLAFAVGLSLAVMAAVSPGAAVMQGLGLQSVLSLLPAVATLISLPLLLLLLQLGVGVAAAAAAPLSGALLGACTYLWTVKKWGLPVRSAAELRRRRPHRAASLTATATGFTTVWTAFFLVDRYVLSPAGTLFLAVFAALQQLAVPMMALAGSVGDGLWAYFETQKRRGSANPGLRWAVVAASGGIGLGLGLVVLVAGERFVGYILGENGNSDYVVVISFALGAWVATGGIFYGAAAVLRHERGLRKLTLVWFFALAVKLVLMLIFMSMGKPVSALGAGVIVFFLGTAATSVIALRRSPKVPADIA